MKLSPFGSNDNERCIELKFVKLNYQEEKNVLDIGFAYAEPRWFEMINSLHIPNITGLDPSANTIPIGYSHIIKEDLRYTTVPDNSFDLVLCISTLEHIGMNNKYMYNGSKELQPKSQITAIQQIQRILKAKCRLILTLPFGKYENHGWFIQYNLSLLQNTIKKSKLKPIVVEFYKYNKYWHQVSANDCKNTKYLTSQHQAGAVVCLVLQK